MLQRRLSVWWMAGMLAGAAACGDAARGLRVMTFNIKYDSGATEDSDPNAWGPTSTGLPRRRERVLKAISSEDPDVFCVQEALHNQVADLKERFSDYGFYGVGRSDGVTAGEYAALFFRASRWSAVGTGTFWLSDTPDVPGTRFPGARADRIASWATLDGQDGERLLLMCTHWDQGGGDTVNPRMAGVVAARIRTLHEGRAVVVMGDLNSRPGSQALRTLRDDAAAHGIPLVDAYEQVHGTGGPPRGTFHGGLGIPFLWRIDHVMASAALVPVEVTIPRWRDGPFYPSDHFPVVVEFAPRAR